MLQGHLRDYKGLLVRNLILGWCCLSLTYGSSAVPLLFSPSRSFVRPLSLVSFARLGPSLSLFNPSLSLFTLSLFSLCLSLSLSVSLLPSSPSSLSLSLVSFDPSSPSPFSIFSLSACLTRSCSLQETRRKIFELKGDSRQNWLGCVDRWKRSNRLTGRIFDLLLVLDLNLLAFPAPFCYFALFSCLSLSLSSLFLSLLPLSSLALSRSYSLLLPVPFSYLCVSLLLPAAVLSCSLSLSSLSSLSLFTVPLSGAFPSRFFFICSRLAVLPLSYLPFALSRSPISALPSHST